MKTYKPRKTYGPCPDCLSDPPNQLSQPSAKRCRACYQRLRGPRATSAPPQAALSETFTVKGDTAELYKQSSINPRTLQELIDVCQIDTSEWTVERWVANKWEVGTKDPNTGDVTTTPLFQIKVWLKRDRPLLDARKEFDALLERAAAEMPPRPPVAPAPAGPYMLELSIPDLHLGKLAWSKETGHANYDLKIAERLFIEALEALIDRSQGFAFEKILFPVGNDLLHSDSKHGMTFAGTQLDTDSRYFKAFATGRKIICQAIDRLRELAPVHVVTVQGNHDTMSAWHLGDSLECYFRNTPDVLVDNQPKLRKYVSFGKVGLMFTHGDKSKATDWPMIFASEMSKMFGETKFREIHTGHLHQTRLIEKNGVRVRISPALCSEDAWHSERGFVGNLRGAEAYIWSKDEGLVSTVFFNVKE